MSVYTGIKFDIKPLISVIEVRGPYCELIHDSFLGEGYKWDADSFFSSFVLVNVQSLYNPEIASEGKAEGLKLIRPGRKFKILKTGE